MAGFTLFGCNGGEDGGTTPPPPDVPDVPDVIYRGRIDQAPEVEARFVDRNLRNESLTDNPLSEDPIFDLINQAQQSLDIAVMRINRQEFVEALLRQSQIVKVRILTEKAFYDNPVYKPFYEQLENETLNNNNIEIRTDLEGEPRMMHSRFMIIDNARTVVGSYDWAAAGAKDTIGDVVILKDSRVTAAFKNQFEQMYTNRLFGLAKQDATQHVWQVGGGSGRIEVYFGPTDDLRGRIQQQINSSVNIGFSIKEFSDLSLANFILNWVSLGTFTDPLTGRTDPLDRNFTGVINDVGFDTTLEEQAIYEAFVNRILQGTEGQQGGLVLTNSSINNGNPYNSTVSNHKYLICDRELAQVSHVAGQLSLAPDDAPSVITGSANWTPSSFDFNDECMVILTGDPLVVKYVGQVNPAAPSFSEIQTDVRPEDFGEFIPNMLQFPNIASPTSTVIPNLEVPYAIIYGVIRNFKPEVTITTGEGGEPLTIPINVMFAVSGKLYLSTSQSDEDEFQLEIRNFDRSESTNPLHGYVITVPAGDLTISPVLTYADDDSPIPDANNPTYKVSVGPGGVRRLDVTIGSIAAPTDGGGGGGG
ncbi:MAG: hypothetical protein HRF49_10615, partial [bacterium]